MIFDKVSFPAHAFTHAIVEDTTLYVYLSTGKCIDIEYDSNDAAEYALLRIDAAVSQSNTAQEVVYDVKGKITDIVDSLKGKVLGAATDKIKKTAQEKIQDSIEERAQKMYDDLQNALANTKGVVQKVDDIFSTIFSVGAPTEEEKPKTKPQPEVKPSQPKKKTYKHFGEDFYSTVKVTDQPRDLDGHQLLNTKVSDLTLDELRTAVGFGIDDAISNNPNVGESIKRIVQTFGAQETEEAMTYLKDLIVNYAQSQPDATVRQAISKFL